MPAGPVCRVALSRHSLPSPAACSWTFAVGCFIVEMLVAV